MSCPNFPFLEIGTVSFSCVVFPKFCQYLNSNGFYELKDLFTFSNFPIISFEIIFCNSVCFVVLSNFWTVFSPVALFSATNAGVCTFGCSGESEGIVEGVVEYIVKPVVCIVFKFCFLRAWRKMSILEIGIPKPKTLEIGDEEDCVKLAGVFYFLFFDCPFFCLSNFLCIVRITCHGVLFVFLHYRPSRWRSIG